MKKTDSNHYFLAGIVILWLGIPLVDLAGRLLPETFFAFRAWELACAVGPDAPGPFRSSFTFKKQGVFGDLANLMKVRAFRQPRDQVFTTDSHGFRNAEAPADKWYPVVTVGDSDMAGCAMSDDQTFPVRLQQTLGVPVYNYAPRTISAFLRDERFRKRPPRLVIWQQIERTMVHGYFQPYLEWTDVTQPPPVIAPPRQPALTVPRLSTYVARDLFQELRWHLTRTTSPAIAHVDQKTGMLFFSAGAEMNTISAAQRGLSSVLRGVENVDCQCRARGITLVYLPLPDKENVYRFLLPAEMQPDPGIPAFLSLVHHGLMERGVPVVDLLAAFRQMAGSGKFMYYLDDTHWNPDGVQTAVDLVADFIRLNRLLEDGAAHGSLVQ